METDIDIITNNLLNQNHGTNIIFLKNMAHHHINVDQRFLLQVKNIFLIRNPAELLVSFSKVIKNPTIEDIGLKKSWELYHTLLDSEQDPIVIDSGELLKDPAKMLEKLCEAINIKYDPRMQSWPAGSRKEDGIWAEYWYHNVHKSTGFIKSEPKRVEVPEELSEVWKEATKYYKELYHHSIKYN